MIVANSEPAAKKRFLHISGSSNGLSPLPNPSSLLSLITSPVSGEMYEGIQRDFWTAYNRPNDVEDESVDAFFTRRFGPEFARIFASALVHGIYATDSRKLSLRAAYPMLWNAEACGGGSVVWGAMKPKLMRAANDSPSYELGNTLPSLMKNAAVYSFKNGLSTLPNALAQDLKSRGNVEIRMGDPVSSIDLGGPLRVSQLDTLRWELVVTQSHFRLDHDKLRDGCITNAHRLRSSRQAVGCRITCRQLRTQQNPRCAYFCPKSENLDRPCHELYLPAFKEAASPAWVRISYPPTRGRLRVGGELTRDARDDL